jgi:hypothetical protein
MAFDTKRSKRPDDGDAFVPDPLEGEHIHADDAESFAEEFIASALLGEPVEEDARDEVVAEEQGGPFLIESAEEEAEPSTKRLPRLRSAR